MESKDKSKYSHLYKETDRHESEKQENRRRVLLEEHKRLRAAAHDDSRNINDFVEKVHKRRNRRKRYGEENPLQLSEWMKGRPEDLDQWFLVPCPKGQRCLLIASGGVTQIYNKYGYFMRSFRTNLPGDKRSRQQTTILDCVLVESARKLLVLDIMAYGNQDLANCDTQFRFYWLAARLAEIEDDRDAEFDLVTLQYYDMADEAALGLAFQTFPQFADNVPELDGFLFYHKDASYTYGPTPLVLWLFGFMVPEVLGFDVHPSHMEMRPKSYVDYLHYITGFDEALRKRKMKFIAGKQRRGGKMDEDPEDEQDRMDEYNDDDENNEVESLVDRERRLEIEGET